MFAIPQFCLTFVLLSLTQQSETCSKIHVLDNSTESNFTLIAVFNFRDEKDDVFKLNGLINFEAFKFAIDKGNNLLRKYLPHPPLIGYKVYDTCRSTNTATELAVTIVLGDDTLKNTPGECKCKPNATTSTILGVVGAEYSSHSQMLTDILVSEKIPVISPFSTSVQLSNKADYPYFMRTVAPDDYQAQAITSFITYHNWSYVSIIWMDDEYGRMGKRQLEDLFAAKKICFDQKLKVQSEMGTNEIDEIVQQLQLSSSDIVILFIHTKRAKDIFRSASKLGLYGKIWLASDSVRKVSDLFKDFSKVLDGLIQVQPYSGHDEDFEQYFWKKKVSHSSKNQWERMAYERYNDQFDDRFTFGDLKKHFLSEGAAFVQDAVYSYFHALLDYFRITGKEKLHLSDSKREIFFNKYLKNVSFISTSKSESIEKRYVRFDDKGNVLNQQYVFLAVQPLKKPTLTQKRAAIWDEKKGVKMLIDIVWNGNGSSQSPKGRCASTCKAGSYTIKDPRKPCCWTCLSCKNNQYTKKDGSTECLECPHLSFPNNNNTGCITIMQHMRYDTAFGMAMIVMSCI